MGKVIAFCIADQNNLKYYEMMKNSLRKFHSEEELPIRLISGEELKYYLKDPFFFYRATPIIASELIGSYECVIKLDADQIITGKLNHIWEVDYDVAVVNNSNPREQKIYPVSVWDIHPLAYVNCGLVAMRSREFIDHWVNLCMGQHFNSYQFREQDLLNILVWYGNYKVLNLDAEEKFHGLASKGYWQDIKLVDNKLILPQGLEWPDKDKEIVALHWAGGNSPDKMNFRIRFQPEVIKRLEELVK